MNSYKQLAYVQRYQISFMLKMGNSQTDIANEIGVHRSTISRELNRNRGKRGYRPKQAHQMALSRRNKAHYRFSSITWDLIESLTRMANGCEKRRYQVKVIERRVGKLLGKNSRSAGLFDIQVEKGSSGGATVTWTKRDDWRDWSRLSEGCYMLRSNIQDWTPEELWKAYIQLTEAEDAFRIQKNDLNLRPIWHQKEERVLAHILVCFLACQKMMNDCLLRKECIVLLSMVKSRCIAFLLLRINLSS